MSQKQSFDEKDVERSSTASQQTEVSSSPHSSPVAVYKSTNNNEKEVGVQSQEITSQLQVTWNGDDDATNPYNWPTPRKWFLTILVSIGSFIGMMSGSMIAPALPTMSRDINIPEAYAELILSIFILAFAFGPLVIAPFSEIYGRKPVWLFGGAFYAVWNVLCGFSHNKGMLIAGRLLSGLGGSVGNVLTWPIVTDMWQSDQRGRGIMVAGLFPVLGPALGPLIGGVMTDTIGWRWIFWWAAIFQGCLVLIALFLLPETSAKRILGNKAKQLRKKTGDAYHTKYEGPDDTLLHRLKTNLSRPLKLLFTSPILILASLFWAYGFGVLYFFLSTFSQLFTNVYHQTVLQSGLHYLSLAIGYVLADQVGAVLMDKLWAYLKAKKDGDTVPEYRIPLLIPGGVLVPVGLLWYGWSAQARVHWIMVDVGAVLFSFGFMLIGNATAAYIVDCFPDCTASAMAAGQVYRMTAGFVFPIIAPAMYNRLDYGWANTTLALIAIAIGLPVPCILWKFGARIRAINKPNW